MLTHARAYSALTAPTVNSYKRLKVGTTASGATWSPGLDLLRLQQPHADAPHPGPRPHRGPDDRRLLQPLPGSRRRARRPGSTASTSELEPGRAELGEPLRDPVRRPEGRGLETLPANLLEATNELEGDAVLREALGRGRDEDYVDYFIRVKRDELARYHEQVTPWEIDEYLTRF